MIVNRVTLLGNKDHGKSTLIGSLLIQTKSVSQQRIDDAKKTSKKLGRKFEPGYILDSFQEEREREMTIDTTRAQVKYKNTGFEFIDVPGHEELMKNMLSGASYADFAILLVSAKPDEGITTQTKRHLFVAKMMGIGKLVVAVNKLDAVGYSQKRFEEIKMDIGSYLSRIGFADEEASFVPVSAYNGENLVRLSPNTAWYKGRSLLDELVTESRMGKARKQRKLLISLQGVFEGHANSVFGKVLSGKASRGDRVIALPGGKTSRILDIFVSGRRKRSFEEGDIVTLRLDGNIGREVKGTILADNRRSCSTGNRIRALLLATKQLKGDHSIKLNGVAVRCKKLNVKMEIDVATGESKRSSRIKPLSAGLVEIILDRDIATDAFSRTPEIGRFVLYTNKSFSGIGIITD